MMKNLASLFVVATFSALIAASLNAPTWVVRGCVCFQGLTAIVLAVYAIQTWPGI